MLYWVNDNHEVTDIPASRKQFYEAGLNRLTDAVNNLSDYINQKIDNALALSKKEIAFFVPGWEVGTEWEEPLDMIWEKAFPHDKVACGKWYGLFVMDIFISREDKWYANKTNFNRPFDQTVYWRRDY